MNFILDVVNVVVPVFVMNDVVVNVVVVFIVLAASQFMHNYRKIVSSCIRAIVLKPDEKWTFTDSK